MSTTKLKGQKAAQTILSRCQTFGAQTPENIGRAFGINVLRDKSKRLDRTVLKAVEGAVDRLNETHKLGLVKEVQQGKRARDRYVVYRIPKPQQVAKAAPPVKTYRDPSLATWTPKVERQQQRRRAAELEAMEAEREVDRKARKRAAVRMVRNLKVKGGAA